MKIVSKIATGLVLAAILFSGPDLSAQPAREAAAKVAQKRAQGGKAWKEFLNRFDADNDRDISAAEQARYAEWLEKRKEANSACDANGNGKIDPGERKSFKQALMQLNREYFVKRPGPKGKKGPGKKGPGKPDYADDDSADEDDLSDIFGE